MMWLPEGEEKGVEMLVEEIMAENLPNLGTDIQIQEAQRVPSKMNPRRPTPRHITIKEPKVKDKERIYEVAEKEQRVIHKGTPIRLSDCSA